MIRLDPSVRKVVCIHAALSCKASSSNKTQGHHEHVRTAGKESKFGISIEELPLLCELLHKYNTTVVALHAHVGSGTVMPRIILSIVHHSRSLWRLSKTIS